MEVIEREGGVSERGSLSHLDGCSGGFFLKVRGQIYLFPRELQ